MLECSGYLQTNSFVQFDRNLSKLHWMTAVSKYQQQSTLIILWRTWAKIGIWYVDSFYVTSDLLALFFLMHVLVMNHSSTMFYHSFPKIWPTFQTSRSPPKSLAFPATFLRWRRPPTLRQTAPGGTEQGLSAPGGAGAAGAAGARRNHMVNTGLDPPKMTLGGSSHESWLWLSSP